MEMKKPRTSPPKRTTGSLLVMTREEPVRLPMGVIPMSTPRRNRERPIMIKTAPTRKRAMSENPSGTKVKFSTKTTAAIGITVLTLSLSRPTSAFKGPPYLSDLKCAPSAYSAGAPKQQLNAASARDEYQLSFGSYDIFSHNVPVPAFQLNIFLAI
jgi:hypothetical protein